MRAKLTGKSIANIQKEDNASKASNKSIAASGNNVYDTQLSYVINMVGNIKVQVGVLAQVQQVNFGGSIGRQFIKIYDGTTFLSPYSGGTFDVVKNSIQATKISGSTVQLSWSGYSQTAVSGNFSQGLNLGVDDLISFGWNAGGSIGGNYYFRKPFSGSNNFNIK